MLELIDRVYPISKSRLEIVRTVRGKIRSIYSKFSGLTLFRTPILG